MTKQGFSDYGGRSKPHSLNGCHDRCEAFKEFQKKCGGQAGYQPKRSSRKSGSSIAKRKQEKVTFEEEIPDDCQTGSPLGDNYDGKENVTISGFTCKKWSDFKFWKKIGEHNYCRNPDNAKGGVWCYGKNMRNTGNWGNMGRWEYCDVPACDGPRGKA